MQTKKTVQGMAWDSIAKKEYGSEHTMDILLKHNTKELDTLLFSGNKMLNIPPQEKASIKIKPIWQE